MGVCCKLSLILDHSRFATRARLRAWSALHYVQHGPWPTNVFNAISSFLPFHSLISFTKSYNNFGIRLIPPQIKGTVTWHTINLKL
jgi:hypothetical protein